MLQKIASEKNDNLRIYLIRDFTLITLDSNPILNIQNEQKLLFQSVKNEDKIAEAMALSFIGYDYSSFGNTQKNLEYCLIATSIGNVSVYNAKTIQHRPLVTFEDQLRHQQLVLEKIMCKNSVNRISGKL